VAYSLPLELTAEKKGFFPCDTGFSPISIFSIFTCAKRIYHICNNLLKNTMYKVFISYTQPDRNIAFMVHDALAQAEIAAWVAAPEKNVMLSGHPYRKDIVNAVGECQVFILIYSDYVNSSVDVKNELSLAQKKVIIPFCVDQSEMCAEVKYSLTALQRISLADHKIDFAINRLVHDVHKHLAVSVPSAEISTDRIMFQKGIKLFAQRMYTDAQKVFDQYISIAPGDSDGRYYYVLSIVAIFQPRQMNQLAVNQLERILYPAVLTGDIYCSGLLSMIKYGYYRMNAMREKPPSFYQLDTFTQWSKERVSELIMHVSDPDNEVWKKILLLTK
jgi:TIR domain